MKKFLIGTTSVLVTLVLLASPAFAAKTAGCTTIQNGTMTYNAGHYLAGQPLKLGFDIFGYNWQAHLFEGSYANAYLGRPSSGLPPYTGDAAAYVVANPTVLADPFGVWPFRDVQLQMKWNDAWLANTDCDGLITHNSTPLDQNNGQGSGAWLTNQATGTYKSSVNFDWDVSGTWNFDNTSTVWPGTYSKTITITQDSSGNITGTGGSIPAALTWNVLGNVIGSNINFTLTYNAPMSGYVATFTGTIANDGTMSGTWSDVLYSDSGTWTSTSGTAVKNYQTCTVSDFIKIVAPPTGAYKDSGVWYNADGTEIGPAAWGSFAIIQEIGSDPCGEYGVIDFMSPLKKGLGGW